MTMIEKKFKKNAAPLGEALNKRLAVYTLAAGAAGVGALGLAQPAKANIIDVTTPITIGTNSTAFLSINGTNLLDFTDELKQIGHHSTYGNLRLAGANFGEFLPSPLAKGAQIGPLNSVFLAGDEILAANNLSINQVQGLWANKSGYLGFAFFKQDTPYFGWAHLSVKANATNGETAFISQFAYETDPNTPILAGAGAVATPEPNTLALLALGFAGLIVLRKKRLS